LVCVWLLAVHPLNEGTIFLPRRPQGRSCEYIPLLAGAIPQGWTDVGQPDWCEAWPGLSPVNTPHREVQQIQVWWIWQPICQSPEFCQELPGGHGGVGRS
jgi:hypothetical protein